MISFPLPLRLIAVTLTPALLLSAALGASPAMAESEPERPSLFGMATLDWPSSFVEFENDAGVQAAFFQDFWSLENHEWPNAWAPNRLTILHDMGVTEYIEVRTDDVVALNDGSKDEVLGDMAQLIADWLATDAEHKLLIAPLPESNLSDHAWANGPADYIAGYNRMRTAILDAGATESQVRFVFAMNGLSSPSTYTYAEFYPGHDVVDIIGFAKLNRATSAVNWRDYDVTFSMHITQMQAEIGRTKPIFITQTGSLDDSVGTRTDWLEDMMTMIPQEDQVIGLLYFNRDKVENGVAHDFRILIDGVVNATVKANLGLWSDPDEVAWIFDGRMDDWVAWREANLASFTDTTGHTFEDDIEWIADQGITSGCDALRYCPDDLVTRAQMATFLDRALDFSSTTIDYFTDDNGLSHEGAINRMAEFGVTLGCGSGEYFPTSRSRERRWPRF